MTTNLDLHDIEVILASLKYGKKNVLASPGHASYEQKQANLREIEEVEAKVRSMRATLREK